MLPSILQNRPMRFPMLLSIVLFSLTANGLLGQGDEMSVISDSIPSNMTNEDVIQAKRWHNAGFTEKSLKKGLEILSSHTELTPIDSFYIYQVLANNFRSIGAHTPSLEYAEKAVEIMARLQPGNSAAVSWIAPHYSATEQYNTAVKYMKSDVKQLAHLRDTLGLLKRYNDIGFTYSLNGQVDSAIAYYHKVIDFETTTDKYQSILGLATGNLGIIYLEKGEYNKALKYIEIDARLNKNRDIDSYYNAVNAIGECYVLMKQYPKAKAALLQIRDVMPTHLKTKLKTYDLLAEAYENTNEPAKSNFYLKKYIRLKEELDSVGMPIETILSQLTASKVSVIRKDLEISQAKVDLINSELMLAQNKVKAQTLQTRIYLIFILLAVLSVFFIVLNHNYRQKKNKRIHQLETDLITAELNSKKQDLTNLVTNLSYVRRFIDQSEGKLRSVLHESGGKTKEELSALIRDFSTYKAADKSIAVLQSDIENVNMEFFKKLEERFPTLTQNERELCGLLVLKLSSKDIAVIRNVSPNAVKKARQRIRKKLPISDSDKIVPFLESI